MDAIDRLFDPDTAAMLAEVGEGRRLPALRWPLLASEKVDGVQCRIRPHCRPSSRRGRPLPNAAIAERLADLQAIADRDGIGFDGELYSPTAAFADLSGAIMSATRALPADTALYVFDVRTDDAEAGYADRTGVLASLEAIVGVRIVGQRLVCGEADARAMYDEIVAGGGEGIVLRDAGAPYGDGDGIAWKLKPFAEFDGRVVAVDSKTGSPIVEIAGGATLRIGTGFSRAERAAMKLSPERVIGRWLTFRGLSVGAKRVPRSVSFVRFRPADDGGAKV